MTMSASVTCRPCQCLAISTSLCLCCLLKMARAPFEPLCVRCPGSSVVTRLAYRQPNCPVAPVLGCKHSDLFEKLQLLSRSNDSNPYGTSPPARVRGCAIGVDLESGVEPELTTTTQGEQAALARSQPVSPPCALSFPCCWLHSQQPPLLRRTTRRCRLWIATTRQMMAS